MRLEKVQEALKTKKIHYEYTEENGCGSIDFMFRGLRFHIWEYEDRVWGAETNVFEAGRSQDIMVRLPESEIPERERCLIMIWHWICIIFLRCGKRENGF